MYFKFLGADGSLELIKDIVKKLGHVSLVSCAEDANVSVIPLPSSAKDKTGKYFRGFINDPADMQLVSKLFGGCPLKEFGITERIILFVYGNVKELINKSGYETAVSTVATQLEEVLKTMPN